jgi:YVTN family beta-propeller protein
MSRTIAPKRRAVLGLVTASTLAGAVGCFVGGAAPTGGPPPSGHAMATGAVVATIPVGRPPTLLAITPDGSRVVAASSGRLSIIRTDTNTVAATVATSPDPTGVTVTPSGHRALWNAAVSAELGVVDLDGGAALAPIGLIVDLHPGGFGRIAVTPDGRTAYIANQPKDYLAVVDLRARQTTELMLDMSPADVAFAPDGRTLYVAGCKEFCTTGTVEVIDTASRQTLRSFAVGPGPYRFALSPDGARAYTTNLAAPSLSIVEAASGRALATIPVGVEPAGLAVSPDGARVYVTAQAQQTLTVVDGTKSTLLGAVAIPNAPREIAVSPDGRHAYVSTRDAVLVLDTQRLP